MFNCRHFFLLRLMNAFSFHSIESHSAYQYCTHVTSKMAFSLCFALDFALFLRSFAVFFCSRFDSVRRSAGLRLRFRNALHSQTNFAPFVLLSFTVALGSERALCLCTLFSFALFISLLNKNKNKSQTRQRNRKNGGQKTKVEE